MTSKKQATAVYSWAFTIDGERSAELYDTREEAVDALAAWSLRIYERTGNFDHDKRGAVISVE